MQYKQSKGFLPMTQRPTNKSSTGYMKSNRNMDNMKTRRKVKNDKEGSRMGMPKRPRPSRRPSNPGKITRRGR